jgi:hypothetical protein
MEIRQNIENGARRFATGTVVVISVGLAALGLSKAAHAIHHPANQEIVQTEEVNAAEIKQAQEYLRVLKYTVTVNGKEDRTTRRAIRSFQHSNKIEVTGRVNTVTLAFLAEAAGKKEGVAQRRQGEGFLGRLFGDIGEAL